LALAYELFGPNLINDRVLELNASDQRGINVVRDKIIKFAKESITDPDPDYPSPPYKIIILDEADAITLDAQAALRKVIESASKITRFCFTCNYIEKIIQPIISRCVKFRFKPLSINILNERLGKIAEFEKIKIDSKCVNRISEISDGDCRKAIMILQNCKYILKMKNTITIEDCDNLTGTTSLNELDKLWDNLINSTIYDIDKITKNVLYEGINLNDLLKYLKNKIINSKINDSNKGKLITDILNINTKLMEKANEYLQLLYLFSSIIIYREI
jgi:replication factor C subunit 2/4